MTALPLHLDDTRPKHCVFHDSYIDLRSGGPTGYLAHLRCGLDRLPYDEAIRIWIERTRRDLIHDGARTQPADQQLAGLVALFSDPDRFTLTDQQFAALMREGTRSVHAHTSTLAVSIHQGLRARGVAGVPLMLTSHCPESTGKEMADHWRAQGCNVDILRVFEARVRTIEAMGFKAADIWVFPSLEAMHPYAATIPGFETWAATKDIRFVPTGAGFAASTVSRAEAKAAFGLTGRTVVSFVGRHNAVKGYDIFVAALLRLLKEREDVSVLVAGAPGPVEAPTHPRWIELGFHDAPGDVLAASDLFVLPNRMTFFDLVLIEALAARTLVLASATGGNMSVHAMTQGAIALYDGSAGGLLDGVHRMLGNVDGCADAVRVPLATAYDLHFRQEIFAAHYATMVKAVHADYGIA